MGWFNFGQNGWCRRNRPFQQDRGRVWYGDSRK